MLIYLYLILFGYAHVVTLKLTSNIELYKQSRFPRLCRNGVKQTGKPNKRLRIVDWQLLLFIGQTTFQGIAVWTRLLCKSDPS